MLEPVSKEQPKSSTASTDVVMTSTIENETAEIRVEIHKKSLSPTEDECNGETNGDLLILVTCALVQYPHGV